MVYRRAFIAIVALFFSFSCLRADDANKLSPQLPKTTPWDLESLSRPPKFTWEEKQSPVWSLFYEGKPYGGKPTRVFAYYASPGTLKGDVSLDKNLPAVVLLHGGGGTAFREWAELWAKRGYAAIAMDLAGHRPVEGENPHQVKNRTRLADGGPNQGDDEKFGSVDKPPEEQWSYHAVANALLAHSLIRSFAGVNSERTAVTGISWGGYLTCIVAGVDNRFKVAVPVYGCGFLHENSVWLKRFAKMTDAQRDRWVQLWDPSRYLPAVSMPILFVNGTNDFAYPLDSYMKSFDVVPSEKQLRVTVKMPHGHPPGWAPKEIGLFVDQHLRKSKPLPLPGELDLKNGTATLRWKGPEPITGAELHYTTDSAEFHQREWNSIPAKISGQEGPATAALPDNATAWFFTVQDERGAVVSSRVVLKSDRE